MWPADAAREYRSDDGYGDRGGQQGSAFIPDPAFVTNCKEVQIFPPLK
jgi:hypothetical protein